MESVTHLRSVTERNRDILDFRVLFRDFLTFSAALGGLMYVFFKTGSGLAWVAVCAMTGIETYCLALYVWGLMKVVGDVLKGSVPQWVPGKIIDAMMLYACMYMMISGLTIMVTLVSDIAFAELGSRNTISSFTDEETLHKLEYASCRVVKWLGIAVTDPKMMQIKC